MPILDTIVFKAAGAGAMAALAPTQAKIKHDGLIVGVVPCGVTLERVTLTTADDARWDSDGFSVDCVGNGGVQDAPHYNQWLPYKVPIKGGSTLVATQAGAGVGYCLVYVEYPGVGYAEAFRPRTGLEGNAMLVSKTVTAGGALTANTIRHGSDSLDTFKIGLSYMPVMIEAVTGGTGPEIIAGFQNTLSGSYYYFQYIPLTEVLRSGVWRTFIPHGVEPVKGGDTHYFAFVSVTTDTPAITVTYSFGAKGGRG